MKKYLALLIVALLIISSPVSVLAQTGSPISDADKKLLEKASSDPLSISKEEKKRILELMNVHGYTFTGVDGSQEQVKGGKVVSTTPPSQPTAPADPATSMEGDTTSAEVLTGGNASCFDHYVFGSVEVDITTFSQKAFPGGTMVASGTIRNHNDYPIVDGSVAVKVFRKQTSEARSVNGYNLVDFYVVKDNLNIPAKGTMPISISWDVPGNAVTGEYQLATFFVTAHKFNLLGLTFTDDILGDRVDFSVAGGTSGTIFFDKDRVLVDRYPYNFAAFTPKVSKDKPIPISVRVGNTTGEDRVVPVTWKLYKWDSMDQNNLIESKQTGVNLKDKEVKEISFEITDTKHPVYLVVVETKYRDAKSLLFIRFTREGVEEARHNFPSILKYPIKAGVENGLFSCAHSMGVQDVINGYSLKLNLLDLDGTTIHSYTYTGPMTGSMMGFKDSFIPKEDQYSFILQAILSKGDTVVDTTTLTYRCDDFAPEKCKKDSEVGGGTTQAKVLTGIVLLFMLFIGAGIYYWRYQMRKKHMNTPPTIPPQVPLIVVLLVLALGGLSSPHPVSAQVQSAQVNVINPHTLYYFYNKVSEFNTVGTPGYHNGLNAGTNITVTYEAQIRDVDKNTLLNDTTPVEVGTTIRCERPPLSRQKIEWFGTGKSKDSPNGYWADGALPPQLSCNAGDLTSINITALSTSCKVAGITVPMIVDVYIPFVVEPPPLNCDFSGSTAGLQFIDAYTRKVTSPGTISVNTSVPATFGKFYYRYDTNGASSPNTCRTEWGCVGNQEAMVKYDGGAEMITPFSSGGGGLTYRSRIYTNNPISPNKSKFVPDYVQNIPARAIHNFTFPSIPAAPKCGDGVKNGAEQCDGADLGGEMCTTQGFTGGALACSPSCIFNTSLCTGSSLATCGNNLTEGSEWCDGTDVDPSVFTNGCLWNPSKYVSGDLKCGANCVSVDWSQCVLNGIGTVTIGGPNSGSIYQSYTFSFSSTDPDGDQIRYQIDWDSDGVSDDVYPSTGYVASGVGGSVSRAWTTTGLKTFRVRVVDSRGIVSPWAQKDFTVGANKTPTAEIAPMTPADNPIPAGVVGNYKFRGFDPEGDQMNFVYVWSDDVWYWYDLLPDYTAVSGAWQPPVSRSFSSDTKLFVFPVDENGNQASVAETYDITVTPNTLPVANILTPAGPTTVNGTDSVTFSGDGTDADPGSSITGYEWSVGGCGAQPPLSTSDNFSIAGSGIGSGAKTVFFRVKDNIGAFSLCDTVVITVNAIPSDIIVIPSPYFDMGNVVLNTNKTVPFTIENSPTAGSPLTGVITIDNPNFTCSPCSYTNIPPGGSTVVNIGFNPGNVDMTQVTTITFSGGGGATTLVQATGIVPLGGNGLDFGRVPVQKYKELDTTIENTGTGPLGTKELLFTDPAFTCVSGCTGSFDVGTHVVRIRFTPPILGPYVAEAFLKDFPTIRFDVRGIGARAMINYKEN